MRSCKFIVVSISQTDFNVHFREIERQKSRQSKPQTRLIPVARANYQRSSLARKAREAAHHGYENLVIYASEKFWW